MKPETGGALTAYLGFGSNMGRRQANLARARTILADAEGVAIVDCSSVYETEPWGYIEQPPFLNCVAAVETTLEPAQLLQLAKETEERLGRRPGIRFGPRPIDIDILLFGSRIIEWKTPDLQIPHPRLAQRAFALTPLAELAGELVHPVLKLTIAELTEAVEEKEGVRLWGPPKSWQ